ncbi:putative SGNH hydrolase-type esterase domain-containing protein [Seiridium cardinale]
MEANRVFCVYPISGNYTVYQRTLFWLSLAFALLGQAHSWLTASAFAFAVTYSTTAAIHGIILVFQKDIQYDGDIFAVDAIVAWAILKFEPHAGGNNCGFGEVVEKCIYQPGFRDWGPEYPDPAGECGKSFNAKNAYIKDAGDFGLYQQEMDTIKDILKHSAVKDNDNFHLYIMGYAQFFNQGDNYCNDISFGALAPVYGPAPKLMNRLRTDLNSAVHSVNDVLARVAKDVNDARVKFIDVSPKFNGHRFCEDKHEGNDWDQWYSTDIWLWNLNFPRYDPPADPDLIQAWLNGSTATNVTAGANVAVEGQGGAETDSGSGGSGGTWMQRPFHPKQGGTNAIADLVIAQGKADKIPGVVGSC